jgi:hypothetical protein
MIVKSILEYNEYVNKLKSTYSWLNKPHTHIGCWPGHLDIISNFLKTLNDLYDADALNSIDLFMIDERNIKEINKISMDDAKNSASLGLSSSLPAMPFDDQGDSKDDSIEPVNIDLCKTKSFASVWYHLFELQSSSCIMCGKKISTNLQNFEACTDHVEFQLLNNYRDALGEFEKSLDDNEYQLKNQFDDKKESISSKNYNRDLSKILKTYKWSRNVKLNIDLFPGHLCVFNEFLGTLDYLCDETTLNNILHISIQRGKINIIQKYEMEMSNDTRKTNLLMNLAVNLERNLLPKRKELCPVCGNHKPVWKDYCYEHQHLTAIDSFTTKESIFEDFARNKNKKLSSIKTDAKSEKCAKKPFAVELYKYNDLLQAQINLESDDAQYAKRLKSVLKDLKQNFYEVEGHSKMGVLNNHWKSIMSGFSEKFPNFSELSEFLTGQFALSYLGDGRISIPPILLMGEPGIGKTEASMWLSDKFMIPFEKIDMSSITHGGELVGTSRHWSSSNVGDVFKILTKREYINPLILMDEIDKILVNHNGDGYGPLHTLLEKRSAKTFKDAFINSFTIDASHINWIATANDINKIPAPIISRFLVINVPSPTRDQSKIIVQNIYERTLNNNVWGSNFEKILGEDVVDLFLTCPSPRIISNIMLRGLGIAAFNGKDKLTCDELSSVVTWSTKKSIGFIDSNTNKIN